MRFRTLRLLIVVLVYAASALAPVAKAAPAPTGNLAPQFLRDVPELQGQIDDADFWTIGGGYLYWSHCAFNPDPHPGGYLRRWPLQGGSVVTLSNEPFCSPQFKYWVADDSGLYYWADDYIYRRSVNDPTNPVAVQESFEPEVPLVLDGDTMYWVANNTIYTIPKTATWDPDPRYNSPISTITTVGPESRPTDYLVVSGDYLYFGYYVSRIPKTCRGECTATRIAFDAHALVVDATYTLQDTIATPLWIMEGDLGHPQMQAPEIRGYSCFWQSSGRVCGASTLYVAPNRSPFLSNGPLATDGQYLYWIQNTQICADNATFPSCVWSDEGKLMRWNLRPSLLQTDPFDEPQPIACKNCSGSYVIQHRNRIAVVDGWVYFDTSNGISRVLVDLSTLPIGSGSTTIYLPVVER